MKALQNQFMNFLDKEVDAYDDFVYNLWRERKMGFLEFLESEEPRHWVQGAFIFPQDETDYWEVIDTKWRLELSDTLIHKNQQP